MTSKKDVVVVDDSFFMQSIISDILEEAGFNIVGTASNGEEAVEIVLDEKPDLVTMDVNMPKMDGLEAVEKIMDEHPTPILMLSAHTDEGAFTTFEALDKGAVDFFAKPGGEVSADIASRKDELIKKAESVAGVDPSNLSKHRKEAVSEIEVRDEDQYYKNPVIVVGSSTGGPNVVESVLSDIPSDLDATILIIQHMPETFTQRFANRLDEMSEYDVNQAEDGQYVHPGQVVVAPGNKQLFVDRYNDGMTKVRVDDPDQEDNIVPSVNKTMNSVAETVSNKIVGVILTGMGDDGAEGIKRIKDVGGHTIAQDEETSVVFGMPGSAIDNTEIDDILPEDEIADGIIQALKKEGKK